MTVRLLVCILTLTLAACASAPKDALYQDLGGYDGIARISEHLLLRTADEPQLAAHFGRANLDRLHAMLTDMICELSGGPCVYRGYSMRETHSGMNIGDDEFNLLVETLIDTMDDLDIRVPVQNRLLAILAPFHGDITAKTDDEFQSGTTVRDNSDFSRELGTDTPDPDRRLSDRQPSASR